MANKRKDSKGRNLRAGESQRRDGRYMYKHTDPRGRTYYLYSWRLDENDPTPPGRPNEPSLREKVLQFNRDLEAGIAPDGGNITVLALVEKYLSQKVGVRRNTQTGYRFVLGVLQKEAFGKTPIRSVRLSDAKAWFIKLQRDGRGYSTIHAIRGVIKPAFQMAVDDDLIRKNPFAFQLTTVVVNDSEIRMSISPQQEQDFLDFVRSDNHFSRYYDGIFILFKTGMRISEFVGLTISDIDMKHRKIHIRRQLQRSRDMQYYIEEPKTESGSRMLPMTEEVRDCFRRILSNRKAVAVEPMIDGHCGFLYLDLNGNPTVALHWQHYFKRICEKYNESHRTPMPVITPHVCRHTYCSNMARMGMTPKTLQYLMGHADVSVTLNIYTHLQYNDVEAEFRKLHAER